MTAKTYIEPKLEAKGSMGVETKNQSIPTSDPEPAQMKFYFRESL